MLFFVRIEPLYLQHQQTCTKYYIIGENRNKSNINKRQLPQGARMSTYINKKNRLIRLCYNTGCPTKHDSW